jgi:hypothetical protein
MATRTSSMLRSRNVGRAACGSLAVLLAALTLDAPAANAQRRPTRRQPTIEIHGTVPTPQVVTVRPREVPSYSRQVLVPRFYDHDFWPEIQEGYAILAPRTATPADTLMLAADSVGTPDLFRLPAIRPLAPLRAQYGTMRKQYEWCAPHWWCPSHRVRYRLPADSAALFQPLPPPQPMAVAPGGRGNPASGNLPVVQQRWCATHWWCPPGGIVTTPPATTPSAPPPAPSDTTRRNPPATPPDSTRRPPGTSSASRLR